MGRPPCASDGPRAAQVVEDRGARILAEHVLGDERRDHVHRNDVALLVDEPRAVGVAVERHAEVVAALAHLGLEVGERLGLERVGLVVREVAVRLAVERRERDRRALEGLRLPGAHAVGEVAGDANGPGQLRERADEGGVVRADVGLRDRAGLRRGGGEGLLRDDALDVRDAGRAGDRDGAGAAELEAVVLLRVVRGGDHHARVAAELRVGVVGDGGGAEAEVDHVRAELRRARGERVEERAGRDAAVAADRDLFAAEERDERAGDVADDALGDLGAVDAADVVSLEDAGHGGVLLCLQINGLLFLRDRRRGLDRRAENQRHAVGDTAQDSAAVVGGRDDLAVPIAEGVVCLRSAHGAEVKAGTELDALDRRHAEHRLGDHAFHAVKHRLADADGQPGDGAFDHAADAVEVKPRGFHLGAHGRFPALVDQGKGGAAEPVNQLCRNVNRMEALVGDVADLRDMGSDLYTFFCEKLTADRAGKHQRRGDPARKMTAAADIVGGVVLDVSGVVAVSRTRTGKQVAVVAGARVGVFNHRAERRAGQGLAQHAGEHARRIAFLAGRGGFIFSRSAARDLQEYFVHADGLACRQSVDHNADTAAVTLAEHGNFDVVAIG